MQSELPEYRSSGSSRWQDLPYHPCLLYTSAVLQIDFTNPTGESNSYGVIATEDASKLLNSPVAEGAFYAYREVLTIKSASKDYTVIVRLTEAYPSPGRIWIKMYNPCLLYTSVQVHQLLEWRQRQKL